MFSVKVLPIERLTATGRIYSLEAAQKIVADLNETRSFATIDSVYLRGDQFARMAARVDRARIEQDHVVVDLAILPDAPGGQILSGLRAAGVKLQYTTVCVGMPTGNRITGDGLMCYGIAVNELPVLRPSIFTNLSARKKS